MSSLIKRFRNTVVVNLSHIIAFAQFPITHPDLSQSKQKTIANAVKKTHSYVG